MGVAYETALASRTILNFDVQNTNGYGMKLKCHAMIVIIPELSGFDATTYTGSCEKCV